MKTPLTHRTGAKVAAFLALIFSALLLTGSVVGAVAMIAGEVYVTPEEDLRAMLFENQAYRHSYVLREYVDAGDADAAQRFCDRRNIRGARLENTDSDETVWTVGTLSDNDDHTYSYHFRSYTPDHLTLYKVTISLSNTLTQTDEYYYLDVAIRLAYTLRYWIYVIALVSLLGVILCFVFLMRAAGHRRGQDTVVAGWGTGVPLDLLTAALIGAGLGLVILCDNFSSNDVLLVIALILGGTLLLALLVGYCMSLAVRIKLGRFWENTVIACLLCWLFLVLKWLWRGLRTVGRGLARLCGKLPLIWKTALITLGITVLEFFAIVLTWYETDNWFVFWIIEKLVLIPLILYAALSLRTLQKGGETLAAGNLDYRVDTRYLFGDLKQYAVTLSRLGEGMSRAVEARMKSERMKTELITNVSHDIKTPLTSIINYADLIAREPCDNAAITEYAGVLHRQSEKLKRLIDDLVEASKASTGNLEVHLAPFDATVMLEQAAGEYEQRLRDNHLIPLVRQPEQPVKIAADGRRLWRVFDNLMGNICKYSLPGSRVYLSLETAGGQAVFTFRNTSRDPLDLTPEELTERFTRGDASRGTDGNGLGLSIAKSLTELQHGTLEVTTDGDLFKVTLRFPLLVG